MTIMSRSSTWTRRWSRISSAIDGYRLSGDDAETVGTGLAKIATLARRWGAFRQVPDHALIYNLVHDSLDREISDRVARRAADRIGAGGEVGHADDQSDAPGQRGQGRAPASHRGRRGRPEASP